MKKTAILSIILFIGISYYTSKSQTINIVTNDSLDLTQFNITPNGTPITGSNILLLTENQFNTKFGTTSNTSSENSEEYDQVVDYYGYSGADVWYMGNKLLGINITNSNYVLQVNGNTTIKVGDNINNLVTLFPNSWALRQNGQVFVTLKNGNISVDTNLVFDVNSSNIVTAIAAQ